MSTQEIKHNINKSFDQYLIDASERNGRVMRHFAEMNGLEQRVVRLDPEIAILRIVDSEKIPLSSADTRNIAQLWQAIQHQQKFDPDTIIEKARRQYTKHEAVAGKNLDRFVLANLGEYYVKHILMLMPTHNGRIVAIDYRAGQLLDYNQDNFDVFVIGADTEEQLIERITNFYGGTWEKQEEQSIQYPLGI